MLPTGVHHTVSVRTNHFQPQKLIVAPIIAGQDVPLLLYSAHQLLCFTINQHKLGHRLIDLGT